MSGGALKQTANIHVNQITGLLMVAFNAITHVSIDGSNLAAGTNVELQSCFSAHRPN